MLLLSVVAPVQEPAVPKELVPVQGNWVVTLFNGEAPPVEIALVIKGNKYDNLVNGQSVETGTLKFDPSKTPAWFDLVIETGDDAGKLQLGVIQVSGDSAILKLTVPGTTARPASLDPDVTGAFVVNLERRK
jgi:uncharacterized protein (TIGR03067 family)